MNINWGTGIAIFYCIFATVLVSAVVKSTTFDNSLVVDNYYEKDLQYQQHMDQVKNTNALSQKVDVQINPNDASAQLSFPPKLQKSIGIVHFFSPISNKEDVEFELRLNEESKMNIPIKQLRAGRWKIKTSWTCANQSYYYETEVIL